MRTWTSSSIGGTILRHSMVAMGATALDAIARLRADIFFLGLTALHPEEGATTGNFEEAAIKRVITSRSAEVVTLATAVKLGAVSPHQIGPAEIVTTLVIAREFDVKVGAKQPSASSRARNEKPRHIGRGSTCRLAVLTVRRPLQASATAPAPSRN